jgi:hypothetical protein
VTKTNEGSLTFRNVHIRFFDVRRKKDGPPFIRIHLSADLSAPIRTAMGWSIGEGQDRGNFGATVKCTHLMLSPNQLPLLVGGREIQIGCDDASDFGFVERIDKDGSSKGIDLLFVVRSTDPEACAKLDDYWRATGDIDSQMKLAYTLIGKRGSDTAEAE